MAERGYGSVLVLGLLLGGVLLVGLASDVARLIVVWRETSHLAHTAAETGAGWVRPDALYRGELDLDVAAADAAARQVAAGDGRRVAIGVTSGEVCVTVEQTINPGLVRLVGGAGKVVAATACAEPRRG